ncbi:DUF2171 domain-containing protein [Lacipirellula parvula]|uniref:DUF2171 domain-containing protein n=1 Tax=Lacipirellula parvula TaxID=2650471 RepID=A0A5K7X4X1_9BACT|nr:DUF2171 domain-containing protein [Lacipirellula parvula]BBO31598.1 hypothetical protein PLANPX_1210 [Lacipirellula parvula]
MADSIKKNVANAGNAVANAAKDVGSRIATGAEDAVDFVKEKTGMSGPDGGTDRGVSAIEDHMEVIASCGKKVGVVDHVEGNAIKLTKNDSRDGQHHFVPISWVSRVDRHVHLTKNSKETEENWKADAASCAR